jgi:hypothetical protein
LENRNESLCDNCSQVIGDQEFLVFQCYKHYIHKDCAGLLPQMELGILPFECYLCKFKNCAEHLSYSSTLSEQTFTMPIWIQLIGLQNVLLGKQNDISLDMLKKQGHNMISVLKIGVAFQNLMNVCKERNRPTFSRWIEFGMTPKLFENQDYRTNLQLNRVLSAYRLTFKKLKMKYSGMFEFNVNRLPAMGADLDTLKCLNLDAPLLAQHKATAKTIQRFRIPYRTWTDELRLDHNLLKLWDLTPESFKK